MKISKWRDRYKTQIPLPSGKYKTVYGKTQKEVRRKANALITEIENGEWVEKNTNTVEGWFNEWVEAYLINLKPTTKLTYSQHTKNHIIPYFGKKKLQSLTNLEIQKFINEKSFKLAPKTVKNIYLVLHKGLEDAVKNKLISSNPSDNISLPKNKKKEMLIIPENKIVAFLETAREESQYADMFEFALLTGMRESELIGLTFSRYDSEEGTILIDRQQTISIKNKFTSPKHDVIRKLKLNDRCIEIIESHIGNGSEYIFSTKDGRYVPHQTLFGHFKRIVSRIGLPKLRVHDLRHTYATLALKTGMDLKTLQNNLGHADASFTLQMYGHSSDEMKKESADKMLNYIENLK